MSLDLDHMRVPASDIHERHALSDQVEGAERVTGRLGRGHGCAADAVHGETRGPDANQVRLGALRVVERRRQGFVDAGLEVTSRWYDGAPKHAAGAIHHDGL